ncbi:dephospho-CoA kinase [Pumilibacter muris]|uniref:dephospho-CoA kinase n=1 Tax=Pumilibacter muris TaxID=2941510 RepID=UPI002041539A|nr:dephospho-CoA kinase [Pumilibacter muris]
MKITVAGLTGGIASGKSAAAEMFRAAGAYIIDTDVIARRVTDFSEVREKLQRFFGEAFSGETLNRRELRKIVFSDEEKRKLLDSVLHPSIMEETKREISEAVLKSASPVIIVVVPLLFETEFYKLTKPNITVACDESVRIERLQKRDNVSMELAESMVRAQMTDEERAARADIVLENDGGLARLRAQVLRTYLELTE